MNNNEYFNYIEEKLSLVATRINNRSPNNLLELNVRAENLYQGLLNRLFKWDLASNNIECANAAGFDLVDDKLKIIIQVSSESSKKKVQMSLDKVPAVYAGYSFKFISISKSAKHLRKHSYSKTPLNLKFNPKEDIYDVSKLIALIGNLDIDRLKEIYVYFFKLFESDNTDLGRPKSILLSCPHIGDNQLIGREKALESLHNRVRENKRFTLVQGMGGLGKSLLCRGYFTQALKRRSFKSYLWITCNNGLDQGLLDPKLIALLKIESNAATCFSVLSRLAELRDCLIVLDNISNNDLDLLESVLQHPLEINNISVISTTREKIPRFKGETLVLDFMSERDGLALYKHYHSQAKDNKTVANIINLAGRHTLTIELLAKTAASSFLSEQELLAKLNDNDFDLSKISVESIDVEKDGINTYDLLSVSLAKVFDFSMLSKEEKELLLLISFLDNKPLSIRKLKEWFDLKDFNLFHKLSRAGWVSEIDESQFSIHQVISSVLRSSNNSLEIPLTSEKIDSIVDKMSSDIEPPTLWFKSINSSQYFSHIGSFTIHAQDQALGQMSILRRIETLIKLCQWYDNIMIFDTTEHYVRKTLSFNEELLRKGFFSKIVLNYQAVLKGLLAESYKKQGRSKEAIPLIEQTVAIRKMIGPPEALAICYTNLGQAWLDENDIPFALENLFKSLALKNQCKKAGSTRVHFSRTVMTIGRAYLQLDNIKEAKKFYDECLGLIETELGRNHAEYWYDKAQIALFYSRNISRLKGKNLAKGAVKKIGQLLHNNHPFRRSVIEYCREIYSSPYK